MTTEQTARQLSDDEYEALWIESALESKAEAEAEWRRRGQTFAFVHPEPTYVSSADWWIYAVIPDPKAPCNRIIRFDLIGGGQIKSIEKFRVWKDPIDGTTEINPDGSVRVWAPDDNELRVTAHCGGDVIKRTRGTFALASLRGPAEINCYAVVFQPGTDQELADRVAATFQAIGDSRDNFFAMLVGGLHCAFCKRPLRDELSRLIGVGPDCAQQHHIPHSHAAAEKRLALRRRLLTLP
jgi:hypothetical protein